MGLGHGYCILAVDPFAVCTAVAKYAKGAGVVVTWEDNANTKTRTFAVVGGMRKYRHARGHGTITEGSDATKFIIKTRIVY